MKAKTQMLEECGDSVEIDVPAGSKRCWQTVWTQGKWHFVLFVYSEKGELLTSTGNKVRWSKEGKLKNEVEDGQAYWGSDESIPASLPSRSHPWS